MAPLSRLASAKSDQTSLQFLRILENGLLALPTVDDRRCPPSEFWKSISDECHGKGLFHYYQAMDFKNQKWPQLYKITLQHYQKNRMLTAKDKMIIRIRRLQEPLFCTTSRETIPLQDAEKSDEPLDADEIGGTEQKDNAMDEDFNEINFEPPKMDGVDPVNEAKSPINSSTGFPPIILPMPSNIDSNNEILHETLKAITRACNLFSEKTLLEIELMKRGL